MSDKKPDVKVKLKLKKLPCGGYGIYTEDKKTSQSVQIGYVGANLSLDGFCPSSEYDR
jgi:hypothetical protein